MANLVFQAADILKIILFEYEKTKNENNIIFNFKKNKI